MDDSSALDSNAPEIQGSAYLYLGPLCITFYWLIGFWLSAGVHLSLWPLYADIHILWITITLQSRKRGEAMERCDKEYFENEKEVAENLQPPQSISPGS
jgi:hypothetical protein